MTAGPGRSEPGRVAMTTTLDYDVIYVDGEWREPTTPDTLTIVNPATEDEIGRAPRGSASDIERAVRAASRAFHDGTWSTRAPADRARAMDRLCDALEARSEEMARRMAAMA